MKVKVGKWAVLRLIPETEDEKYFLKCLTQDNFRLQVTHSALLEGWVKDHLKMDDKLWEDSNFVEFELQQHQPEEWKGVLNLVTAVAYGKKVD